MRRQLLPALGMLIVFTVLTGLLYPLAVTGVAQAAFTSDANGSLVKVNGRVVGSKWIGQPFTATKYFHPRPAADGYVPGAQGGGTYSYGSNYGPTDARLIGNVPGVNMTSKRNPDATAADPFCVKLPDTRVCDPNTVPERVLAYRAENGIADRVKVPVDAVTASGSGLDPQISVANARLQAPRVASSRHMNVTGVLRLVKKYTDSRGLGFLGEPGVNVLQLNVALDRASA